MFSVGSPLSWPTVLTAFPTLINFIYFSKKKNMQHLAVGPRERGPGQSMAALLGLEDERKFQEERQNTGKEPSNHRDPLELLPGTKLGLSFSKC